MSALRVIKFPLQADLRSGASSALEAFTDGMFLYETPVSQSRRCLWRGVVRLILSGAVVGGKPHAAAEATDGRIDKASAQTDLPSADGYSSNSRTTRRSRLGNLRLVGDRMAVEDAATSGLLHVAVPDKDNCRRGFRWGYS